MNLEEVRKFVSQVKGSLFKNSNSQNVGMLKSQFRGSGIKFKEHRVYQHGDEIRFIDWKMLAKTSQPYIKTFEEDRNVEICVVIDLTPGMQLADRGKTKFQVAVEVVCLLYLLSKESGDFVKPLILGDRVYDFKPMSGEKGISYFIATLEKLEILNEHGFLNTEKNKFRYSETTDLDRLLRKYVKKRKEVIILSDFTSKKDLQQIDKLLYQKNVYPFRVISDLDLMTKFPFALVSQKGLDSTDKVEVKGYSSRIQERFHGVLVKPINISENHLEDFLKGMR